MNIQYSYVQGKQDALRSQGMYSIGSRNQGKGREEKVREGWRVAIRGERVEPVIPCCEGAERSVCL